MRISGSFVSTFVCAVLLASTSAGAARAGEFGKSGGYFGVNGAYGLDLFSTELASAASVTPPPLAFDDSWGLNARVGYRIFPVLAAEVQYEWMKGIDISTADNSLFAAGTPVGTWKPHTLTANLKLYLPIWRVQPYLLAGGGVGIWSIDFTPIAASALGGATTIERTGFAFRGGAGLDVFLTESIALNGEGTAVLNTADFNDPTNSLETSLYYFSISAGFTFFF